MLQSCLRGANVVIGARAGWPHADFIRPLLLPSSSRRVMGQANAVSRLSSTAGETLTTRVLTYWFGAKRAWYDAHTERYAMWYGASTTVDDEIRSQFNDDVVAAVDGRPSHMKLAESGVVVDTLALVILLDQFTRNIYRGSARAFAGDEQAAIIARRVVREDAESGLLQAIQPARRLFMYMPLMHSESIDDQHMCVDAVQRLLDELKDDGPPAADMHQAVTRTLGFAEDHRDTVARFGRFPHRNKALGRETTPAELEYLQDANTYGQ